MNIKFLGLFGIFLAFVSTAVGQNNFEIHWNSYTTGDLIEDDPFLGSFTITNFGETTIPVGDTIWYGYLIDGISYDLSLSEGLVSGLVLTDEFLPEQEIAVINNFYWPLWGSGDTVDICAVVYGAGIATYETPFLYDTDTTNNMDCVSAILPIYSLSTAEQIGTAKNFLLMLRENQLIITHKSDQTYSNFSIYVSNLMGQLIYKGETNLESETTTINLPEIGRGSYIVSLVNNEFHYSSKVVY